MDSLEEIRKRKLQELLKKQQAVMEESLNEKPDPLAVADQYVKYFRRNLDEKAYERLMNVRMINPNLYLHACYLLYQMKSTGRLQKVLTDEELKRLLLSMLPKERETRIIRK